METIKLFISKGILIMISVFFALNLNAQQLPMKFDLRKAQKYTDDTGYGFDMNTVASDKNNTPFYFSVNHEYRNVKAKQREIRN